MNMPSSRAITTYAVICKWADRRREPVVTGAEVLVVEARDANAAHLAAHTARPDLWETADGLYRETAVHPAQVLA